MKRIHSYKTVITWTGNKGAGTSGYAAYDRSHTISVAGKPTIKASSDVSFRGDADKYNPEELLVASLSSCHMLWFLHLCADSGIVVVAYEDHPTGIMAENEDGSGCFTEVTLNPLVTILQVGLEEKIVELHHKAHAACFIANSVNFPVYCIGETFVAQNAV